MIVAALLGCRPAPPAVPDVVVLVLDDVGVDKVSAWGDPAAPPTPTLDALAARGVVFRQAWATPSCSPTRAALLTGRFGRRMGIGEWMQTSTNTWGLPEAERTLPERLRDAPVPYASALAGKWHLSARDEPGAADAPRRHGFDHHRGSFANLDAALTVPPPRTYTRWERLDDGVPGVSTTYATTAVVDDALALARSLPSPFLLVVAPNAPHAPLHAPPGRPDPGTDRARYDAALTALDAELGRLLAALDPARTVVIAVGDNGTPAHALARPGAGKHEVGDGGVRVPLVVAGPGIARGAVSDAVVSVVDVVPTVLALAGAPADGPPLDGVDLGPWLRDPAAPTDRIVVTEHFFPNGPPPWAIDEVAARDAAFALTRDRAGERLVRLGPRPDDAPDLLVPGREPTPEEEAAYARLAAALDAHRALPFAPGR